MKTVGGHQPHVFPGIEYLARMSVCDVWIYSDDAKFNRHDWQNRNRIKSPFGWQYVTIPVAKAEADERIVDKQISYARKEWPDKLWATLEQTYGSQPHFQDVRWIRELLLSRPPRLVDLIRPMMERFLAYLQLTPSVVWASALPLQAGPLSERLAQRVQVAGGVVYATGPQGWTYLDMAPFRARRLQVRGYIWKCPEYAQRWSQDGFLSDLSIVDLIANEGPRARELLRQGIRLSEGQGGALQSPEESHADA